ncbi:MAG: membrane protein insertase YidC [Candidatus Omnitrophica bacterium]|nr:membrane protein insertase YidC [Candidatus Omnitrophota bacterium]MDD3987624.1 membrane protein insertase YidC [Candidatus Omnitrophota bacterium]
MEKRLIVAIALSLLVLLSWSALMPKPQHIAMQDVSIKQGAPNLPALEPVVITPSLAPLPSGQLINYKQDNFEITFDESIAAIKDVTFKYYNNYLFTLTYGCLLKDPLLSFRQERVQDNIISFIAAGPDKKVTKKYTFHKSSYTIDLEIEIKNTSNSPISVNLPLVLGVLDFSSSNHQARFQDITISTTEKMLRNNGRKNTQFDKVKFLGLRDQYFTAIIEADQEYQPGFVLKLNSHASEVGINVQNEIIQPGAKIGHLYHIYIGPQDLKIFNSINPAWAGIIHYGTFDFISQILLQTLDFLHKIVRNWGVAIILLSLLVYLILYPLSIKQMRSMKEMQVLQPKVEALRKANKDNPQKMNKEIMELYKEHKVNPLGGCLPLLLQMPIFFALYNALMRSIVLKGAEFLWIKDLSEPDRLWIFPSSWPNLPVLGNELNVLPIIMAIGMFVQQKISSASSGGAAAEQQKIMLIVMPIIFGLIFYRMPSGLVLYWFVNSMLMLIFQLRMNRAK